MIDNPHTRMNTTCPNCLDLLDVVKSQRLMLYAWKGAQIKNGWPWDHIQAAINETEAAIAKATGEDKS